MVARTFRPAILRPKLPAIAGGAGNDPNFASVLLLVDNEDPGATFIDHSSYGRVLGATGSTAHSTSNPRFGTQCAVFSGNGSYFAQSSNDWNFPGRLTFELWIRPESATTGDFLSRRVVADNNNLWGFRFNSDGTLRFFVKNLGSTGVDFSSSVGSALSLNAYHYVGLTRDDPTTPGVYDRWRIWADGAVIATNTGAFSFPGAANNLLIGAGDNSGTGGFVGRIDGVRITSGVARDLSVVPAAEFPSS